MRLVWRLIRRRVFPTAFALAGTALVPAFAGQPAIDLGLQPGLPPAADTGKPAIVPPAIAALGRNPADRCLPPLPCGTQLLGTLRKNGAVEIRVPALSW